MTSAGYGCVRCHRHHITLHHCFTTLYRFDFLPTHLQALRDKRNGLFGFRADFGYFFIWAALLAQYASAFLVPGRTRGPPSDDLPD